ncbi:MAG: nicotinate (nicotinamide) nucleotide adenylyltransferase [Phycisphaeraceae bacterium]|nr:nicotinate (nicotinamide) nucleotide adenylyltransferase [Phycisphaeraceae bacterium]
MPVNPVNSAQTDLADCRRMILFGGTFDPPQVAHVEMPRRAREAIGGANVIAYVPAAISPFKMATPPTPAHHRLAMLALALGDRDGTMILTDELDATAAGAPSYTIDTVERLAARLGANAEIRLLIGSDQLVAFTKWKDFRRLESLASPIVMRRPPDTRDDLLRKMPPPLDPQRWRDRILDIETMEISSSEIRRRVAEGMHVSDLVPPAVADYIAQHKLYQAV